MNNFVVCFVISGIVTLGQSTPYHLNPYNSFYQAYNPQRWGYSYGYNPHLYLHTMKARTDAVAERAACKGKKISSIIQLEYMFHNRNSIH